MCGYELRRIINCASQFDAPPPLVLRGWCYIGPAPWDGLVRPRVTAKYKLRRSSTPPHLSRRGWCCDISKHEQSGHLGSCRPPGDAQQKSNGEWGTRAEKNATWYGSKKLFTLLDLCVSSLRRGHANLLCIVPILTDDPRRESEKYGLCMPFKRCSHTAATTWACRPVPGTAAGVPRQGVLRRPHTNHTHTTHRAIAAAPRHRVHPRATPKIRQRFPRT